MDSKRILIVEDEQIVAADLERTLQRLGYEVVGETISGEEALEVADQVQPDLVLMDMKLQGALDGTETAKRLHSRQRVPIIYLTAFTDAATIQRAKSTEPFGYLLKPFDERQLHLTIEIALYKHQVEMGLRMAYNTLERKIREHTREIIDAEMALREETAKRTKAEHALLHVRAELAVTQDELDHAHYLLKRRGEERSQEERSYS